MDDMRFCTDCGTIVRRNETHCSGCGALTPLGQRVKSQEIVGNESVPEVGRANDSLSDDSVAGYQMSRYLATIVCIAALLLAIFFDWPYAYYVLLRLAVCAVSLYWVVEVYRQGGGFWLWAFAANALLFNPILPVRMARSDWEIVNLLDAIFLASWTIRSIYKEEGGWLRWSRGSSDRQLPRYHRIAEVCIVGAVVATVLIMIYRWLSS